ncbi:MAG TPA: carboxypeptidase-like regulatory domain-containing protein [Longimicrobium sp.]|nr:carboxypeptidase-like regulatory domain-containing protein [Longimicrobium sp.]
MALSRYAVPLLSLLVALLASGPISAQTVRGVLVDDAGRPVDGTVVGLYPATGGRALAGGLTDGEGRFSLAAPAAGRYLVRAERIGYQPAQAEVELAAGETEELRLATAVKVFVLAPVEVTADMRCVVRPGAGMRAYELWQQAAVALRATELVEDQELVEYTIRTYRRDLIRSRRTRRDPPQRVRGQPFETLSPAELAEHGYLRDTGDTITVYGPDATVLLSDEFQDTHCLYVHSAVNVRTQRGQSGQVGLAFEPAESREVVDIRGTMWLDARTGELRSVEYEYTGLPDGSQRSPSRGVVEFQRLPSGAWIVSRWNIRTARILYGTGPGSRRGTRPVEVLGDVREAGGEVSEITVVAPDQPSP